MLFLASQTGCVKRAQRGAQERLHAKNEATSSNRKLPGVKSGSWRWSGESATSLSQGPIHAPFGGSASFSLKWGHCVPCSPSGFQFHIHGWSSGKRLWDVSSDSYAVSFRDWVHLSGEIFSYSWFYVQWASSSKQAIHKRMKYDLNHIKFKLDSASLESQEETERKEHMVQHDRCPFHTIPRIKCSFTWRESILAYKLWSVFERKGLIRVDISAPLSSGCHFAVKHNYFWH